MLDSVNEDSLWTLNFAFQATSSLVGAIRGEAESHSDSEMQKRLLAAARQLADATANMVEAAKVRHAGRLSCMNVCQQGEITHIKMTQ